MTGNLVELTCKEVVEAVTDYLQEAMSPGDRVLLEQHLLVCAPCMIYLDQMRRTIDAVHELADAPPTTTPETPAPVDRVELREGVRALLRARAARGGRGG